MNTAVVKFDALSDAVRAASQDHYLELVGIDMIAVRRVVSGIVVCAVLRPADMYAFPRLFHTEGDPAFSYSVLCDVQDLAQIFIGEAVFFG